MGQVRAHVIVSGRVQGVWFRRSTYEKAISLGLHGWVRNLADGRVEAIFEGEEHVVKEAIDFVRKGPRNAQVENVDLVYEDFKKEFSKFSIC